MYYSKRFRILATGSYAPMKVLTNEELSKTVSTTSEWIYANLGIKERRIAASDEFTSDVATRAALVAIETSGIDKEEIDLILVATATPDRKAPSTACIVKHKLGIKNHCPAFDLAAVCSGFVYGMCLASSLIESGAHKKILLIGADTFSKITDWNRRDCVFFGDGAGAVLLGVDDTEQSFFAGRLYSETENTDNFTVYPSDESFTMNGKAVYETGSTVLPKAIGDLLQENGFQPKDLSCIIPHQPSKRLLETTAQRLEIPFEKIHTNMEFFANTSGATVPLLLDEVARNKAPKKGDLVAFAAVGSGWTWGAALYRW